MTAKIIYSHSPSRLKSSESAVLKMSLLITPLFSLVCLGTLTHIPINMEINITNH